MSEVSKKELLRSLPQVEEVLKQAKIEKLEQRLPRSIVVEYVRNAIQGVRESILDDSFAREASAPAVLAAIVEDAHVQAKKLQAPSLRKVINVSGVIIHTNLGRSVLAKEAVEAVREVAEGYSTLEYDPQNMARGSRHTHCEELICALTGAEAAIAVNNNAAAVMMVLSEFAAGHEAIVSRGELVEIGGSFRVPDIMRLSHAAMVEVGTTNKTHRADYERALTHDTTMLLKVHPSNYQMVGFTESVDIASLRTIADEEISRRKTTGTNPSGFSADASTEAGYATQTATAPERETSASPLELIVYEDQGSGAFIRLDCFGEYAEPTVAESLKQGCDLVSFSGDKLLGGPQAGIIVGKKTYIDRLKKNPLARALRLDKMTLAALEATLRIYLDEDRALRTIPTLNMLSMSADEVRDRAKNLHALIKKAIPSECAKLSLVEEIARAGGGSLPMCDIPSYAVSITFLKGNAQSCEKHLASKRKTPLITRIKKEAILCDPRTLVKEEDMIEVAEALKEYFETLND